MIKNYFFLILKGIGMGAANIIPGVSGGTIALITGVFERLIDAIKSFNLTALKLLLNWKIKDLIKHIDLYFLIAVFGGAVISVFTLAFLLKYLFEHYEVQVLAYFFGLIMASVYFVGRTIEKWNTGVIITFVIGTAIAVLISVMNPATQNDSFLYLIICGVVAICSMILPGLSGSYVLLLMGNYQLVMLDAVSDLNLKILLPVIIGAVGGLIAFSHFLSWVYKKYKNQTIATLSGFILGSLAVIWPWKVNIYAKDEMGDLIIKDGEKIIQGWERYLPELNMSFIWAIAFVILGILTIWVIEKLAARQNG